MLLGETSDFECFTDSQRGPSQRNKTKADSDYVLPGQKS